jgi:hypothetical protein
MPNSADRAQIDKVIVEVVQRVSESRLSREVVKPKRPEDDFEFEVVWNERIEKTRTPSLLMGWDISSPRKGGPSTLAKGA